MSDLDGYMLGVALTSALAGAVAVWGYLGIMDWLDRRKHK